MENISLGADFEYGEREKEVIPEDSGFISDTGEIVVMDTDGSSENFQLKYVDITDIAVPKRIRISTVVDELIKSIKSTGLLSPVIVAPTATEGSYVLLDGYRRMLACARSGIRNIPCIINNKVSTPEIPILEALYNHNKDYSIEEIKKYIDYLETQKGIMSGSMIEYLLQLNSGDYTKLKDLLEDGDEEILEKLYNGQFTIEMAFRKLEQRRKKESQDEKDIRRAEKVYENEKLSGADDIAGSGEEVDDEVSLTDEEIKSLVILPSEIDEGIEEASLEEMVQEGKEIKGYADNKQDPNNRTRLDPALRKSVLARDNNTCQICKDISGPEYVEVLDVHHIQEVYLGGTDNMENLVTACVVCHKLVHLYARGELHMRPIDQMEEAERNKFKRVVRLGTVIRKGMELKGMKKEELKKMDKADTIGRRLKGSSDQVAG